MEPNYPNHPQDGFGLKTLSENGQPPKSRLDDANHTFSIVQRLMTANEGREKSDAQIQSVEDGNPPYNSSKLRAAGQANRANFNTLEYAASKSSACAPYYDLFAAGKHYAVIQSECDDVEKREEYSNILTEEMDRVLENLTSFDNKIWGMINDFIGFGKGFLMWEDTLDWRLRRVNQHRLLVPDGTETEIEDDFELFVVLADLKVHRIYNRIRDETFATSLGWRVGEAKAAIRRVTARTSGDTDQEAIEVQNQIRDHDLSMSMRMPAVQVAHVFVREFNSKWSHFIIERNGHNVDKGFLYRKVNRFEDASQIIAPFFFEVKSGSWHGATGLGAALFAPMQLKNRLRCAQMDALFRRMGLTFQAKTAAALQKAALSHFGQYDIIGPDVDVMQATIFGDIESSVAINRDLDSMLEANTGIYRPRLDPKPGNPMTLGEFQQRMSMASVLGNSAVNRFYSYLDPAYKEMYRRLSNPNLSKSIGKGAELALEFQARCIKRGVPKKDLLKIESVKADRNMGNGSASMRQQALGALAQFLPMFPENGRANFIDDTISVYTNEAKVERYNPKPEKSKLATDQEAFAMLQVASMREGIAPVITPTQNPVIFAQTFLKAGAESLGSVVQGANPVEVLMFLELVGPAAGAHIQRMSQDPTRKQIVEALTEQWKELAKSTDDLRAMVEKQQEAQAKRQQEMQMAQQRARQIGNGEDPDTVIKAAQLNAKIEMDRVKTSSALALKSQKAQQGMAIADMQAASKIRIAKETADAKSTSE